MFCMLCLFLFIIIPFDKNTKLTNPLVSQTRQQKGMNRYENTLKLEVKGGKEALHVSSGVLMFQVLK